MTASVPPPHVGGRGLDRNRGTKMNANLLSRKQTTTDYGMIFLPNWTGNQSFRYVGKATLGDNQVRAYIRQDGERIIGVDNDDPITADRSDFEELWQFITA